MRIQFIYLNCLSDSGDVQLGIATLSAILKLKGHETSLIHIKAADRESYLTKAESEVKKFKPDLIGISATEMDAALIGPIADLAKEKFGIAVAVGGPYPTLAPSEVLESNPSSYVFRGESDNSFPLFVDKLERGKPVDKIPGLAFKKNSKIKLNPLDKPPGVDKLPLPDRTIYDEDALLGHCVRGKRRIAMMASRGCPFDCTYCINTHLKSMYPCGPYVRFRNVSSVIDEIHSLNEKYDFDYITFYDDTMLLNKKWIDEFSNEYKKEFDIPFTANARPETCTRELVDTIASAGCSQIDIGIESGSEKIRKEVLNRASTNQQIIQAFKNCRENEISTYSFNMIGLPYETQADIKQTIRLNAKAGADFIQVSIFYPLKGTKLGDLCYEKGWVVPELKEKVESYTAEAIVTYPQLSSAEINKFYSNFSLLCYVYGKKWRSLFGHVSSGTLRKLHLLKVVEPMYRSVFG